MSPAGACVVHYSEGSAERVTDFRPLVKSLSPGAGLRLAPSGGRSSDGVLPYFNVAGPGAVTLSQAAHIMGRRCAQVIPPAGGGLATMAMKRLGVLDWPPHLLRLVQYGRVVDVRRLREAFGWQPWRSSWQVLHDCAGGRCSPSTAATVTALDGEAEAAVPGRVRPRVVHGAGGS